MSAGGLPPTAGVGLPDIGAGCQNLTTQRKLAVDTNSLIDELSATLGVYGEELEPEEIARILGVAPSRTVRRGDRDRRGRASPHGAYLLTRTAESPERVIQVVDELLDLLPDSEEVWAALKSCYTLQLRLGASTYRVYAGFGLSPAQIGRLARMQVEVEISIYVMRPEDDDEQVSGIEGVRKH